MSGWADNVVRADDDDRIVAGRPAFVELFWWSEGVGVHASAVLDAWLNSLPGGSELWCSNEKTKKMFRFPAKAEKIRDEYRSASLEERFASNMIKTVVPGQRVDECHAYSLEFCDIQDEELCVPHLPGRLCRAQRCPSCSTRVHPVVHRVPMHTRRCRFRVRAGLVS